MAPSASEIYSEAFDQGLRPDPLLTVSEWADKHRRLSARASSEPGPWRTSRTPYLREIMDVLSPSSPIERVVFMKGAQIGASETGNNMIGYVIHHAPGPMLAVMPTVEMAKRNSKQRIDPLIEESEALKQLVKPARSRDSGNTVLAKEFPGGLLVMTGANSAVGLRSMPVRYLFLDEVDGYPGDVDGEGDPIALAEARTRTFSRRKIFIVSTPTIKGISRIEREYEASDQRRYFVPCPHCGHMQWLQFERLRWDKGEPETAHYLCESCEVPIDEHHKTAMLESGEWKATAETENSNVAGFHISALYSPVGWISWGEIARHWEAAQGNDAAMKAAKNTLLGETWAEKGEAPDWQRLYDRREDYTRGTVPMGGLFLTAGVDVQHDRIEVDIWAWGRGLQSWLVDHILIDGDPVRSGVWAQLTKLLPETWSHEAGGRLGISKLAVDSGDGNTTALVYAWARAQGAGQVLAIKGRRGFERSAPVSGPTYVEVTQSGRKLKRGVRLWTISVAVFKSETYRLLRLDRPTDEELAKGTSYPNGFIHLPRGIDSEWIKQLTAEQLVTIKNRQGFTRLEWQKLRERNEALDNRVYARAAAWVSAIDRWPENKWQELEDQLGVGASNVEPGANTRKPASKPRRRIIGSPYMNR